MGSRECRCGSCWGWERRHRSGRAQGSQRACSRCRPPRECVRLRWQAVPMIISIHARRGLSQVVSGLEGAGMRIRLCLVEVGKGKRGWHGMGAGYLSGWESGERDVCGNGKLGYGAWLVWVHRGWRWVRGEARRRLLRCLHCCLPKCGTCCPYESWNLQRQMGCYF